MVGKIKELQIFNTELEDNKRLMNIRLNNNYPDFSNLIAYYPINDGSGSYILDNSVIIFYLIFQEMLVGHTVEALI